MEDDSAMKASSGDHKLTTAVARTDEIPMDEARAVVEQAFYAYLAQQIPDKFLTDNRRHHVMHAERPLGDMLRQIGRRVPGLRATLRRLRSVAGRGESLSLSALVRPSSPYHASFKPVYEAIAYPQTWNQRPAML